MSKEEQLLCEDCENQSVCPQWTREQNPKEPCKCNEHSQHSIKVNKIDNWANVLTYAEQIAAREPTP
jgi:hypothetical protein